MVAEKDSGLCPTWVAPFPRCSPRRFQTSMGMGCRSQLPSGHGISGNRTPCPLVGSPAFFSGNSSTASLEFLQGTLEAPLPPLQGVHTPASRQACLWTQLWGQAFRALGTEPLMVPSPGSGPSRTLIFIPKADVPVASLFFPAQGLLSVSKRGI